MSSIGNLAVQLSLDAGGFDKGVDGTLDKMKQLNKSAEKVGQGSGSMADKLFKASGVDPSKGAAISDSTKGLADKIKGSPLFGMADKLGSSLGVDLGGMLDKGLGMIPPQLTAIAPAAMATAAAVAAAAKAISAMVEAGRKLAHEQLSLGKKFGVPIEAAGGMQLAIRASGMSMDDAGVQFGRYNRLLGMAAAGHVESNQKFRQIGLDVAEMRLKPMNEQMAMLGQKFRDIKDPAERARQVTALFGEEGAKMLPTLMRLADPEYARLARNSRVSLNGADASKLEEARQAERRTDDVSGAMTQGVQQRMAVAAAPVITTFNQVATEGMRYLQPLVNYVTSQINFYGNILSNILKAVKATVAPLKPLWDAFLDGVHEIQDVWDEIFNDDQAGDWIKDMGKAWNDFLKPVVDWLLARIRNVVDAIKVAIGLAREAGGMVQDTASALTFGLVPRSEFRAAKRSPEQQNNDALAAEAEQHALVADEVDNHRRALVLQANAIGQASNAAQLLELRQRGASEASLAVLRYLHASIAVRQVAHQQNQQEELLRAQIAGIRGTVAESRSAAEIQLVQQLRTQGVADALIQQRVEQLRINEGLQRQLQLQTQIRETNVQWRNQARDMGISTELQRGGMSGPSAQREVQIREMERQLLANARGGIALEMARAQIETLRANSAQLALAEMMEAGRQLQNQLRNPLEIYNDRIAELGDMLMAGAVDWDTYSRAVSQAAEQLERASGIDAPNAPQALAQGSREAIALINRQQREDGLGDREERVRRAIEQQTRVQEQIRDGINRLAASQLDPEAMEILEVLSN